METSFHFFYLPILILFLLQQLIWFLTALQSEKEKPKTKKRTVRAIIERLLIGVVFGIICSQLLGVSILPFSSNKNEVILISYIFYLSGMIVSLLGRKEIYTNWTGSYDYQIKDKHSLITSGIYQYIRHPIYIGLGIMIFSVQLLVQSYLLLGMPILFFVLYRWAKREEYILERSFKAEYVTYKKSTKMFFPFIF